MSVDLPLISALQRPEAYDHPVERIELIETHISWVLLTGAYAYKVKKPVNLGFVDFSSLEKRRFYCHEELRLNRRLAPQIYLAVVPITGTARAPRLGGAGAAIEYAVKMVQFPQEDQLDRRLARGALPAPLLDRLAERMAAFHGAVEVAGEDTAFGRPERLILPMRANFEQLLPAAPDSTGHLAQLRAWTEASCARLRVTLIARKRGGFVRECHGDMHLANMAWFRGELVIFDGIEFNEQLRWIDVMSELAFLTMDLEERGHPDLAWRVLNGYLEHTGDYGGLAVLRFYQVYRAMVRAKVSTLRRRQSDVTEDEGARLLEDYRGYLALAERYTRPPHPLLVITHGLSGSGKTWFTGALLERWGAVRLRSDIERKRLFGLPPLASSRSALDRGIYDAEAGERTYRRLWELARTVLTAEPPVIVDAAFLQRERRERFRRLAADLRIPFAILDFTAPEQVLRERVARRRKEGRDASEADLNVLARQMASREPLTADEQALAIPVDAFADAGRVAARLEALHAPAGTLDP